MQSKSINFNFGHFWAKYQGYSLTLWPKLPHFHHFSMCNQNQSISISVIFGQNTKAIALLFGQNCLIFITFQCQSISVISKSSIVRSKSINFNWAKYQGYSLTFWPKLPHFHHFSMCNQNQSISISVIVWAKYQGYSLKIASFSSLFNVQSKSINFNFGHFWAKYQGYSRIVWPKLPHFHHFSMCNQNQSISISVIFGQNTKAIALLFSQTCLILITFQCAIKINQFQFRSFLGKIPRL